MKANEAPEKIYINDFGSELSFDWHQEHCADNDIEYIRTDAFIKKACDAFCRMCDIKECDDCAECTWKIKFRRHLEKL